MRLGIEIGGTKLQLGVGDGTSTRLAEIVRKPIDRAAGAAGILAQIEDAATDLKTRHQLDNIGIGFGGPVDSQTGTTLTSHQVNGWDNVALGAWCERTFGLPARIGNDCDVAALAEARFGAGRGRRIVLYVTAGTGVGGGLVADGALFADHRVARAEIGHLRPGIDCTSSHDTVESIASGPGIVATARALCTTPQETGRLLADAGSNKTPVLQLNELTGRDIATAAGAGNPIAQSAVDRATRTLGWAIAQAVTLTSAEVVVIGGGVSKMHEIYTEGVKEVERQVFSDSLETPILKHRIGDSAGVIGAALIGV